MRSGLGPAVPRLLTIAGSASGGGAGIQADLKTFAAHGAFGMSAVVALTAQNTLEVRAVHGAPPDFVAQQIDVVFEDLGVDGVKIGMLATPELVRVVAERLRVHARPDLPVVLDPVMISKSGARLLAEEAVAALREELLPIATLVTPNLPELESLTGLPAGTETERLAAAAELGALGPAVLAKGGHGEGEELVDLLWTELENQGGFEIFGHRDLSRRVGTLSFRYEGLPAAELGGILDQAFDIAIRPGLHCAPYIHQAIGTAPEGAVRVSPGPFNQREDIERLAQALREIAL